MTTFKVKVLKEGCAPSRAHPTDAGLDLRADNPYIIAPLPKLVKTGVCVAIPKGYVGLVYIRSSLAKRGVHLANSVGVIDSDYRGEIQCMMYCHNSAQIIDEYERIAQLVVVPCVLDYKMVNSLDDTERGDGGFGHTGRF